MTNVAQILELPKPDQLAVVAELNQKLEKLTAEERLEWGLEHLPGSIVMSSSFGIQAAVTLHMVTRQKQDMPVILTDTGYLFKETYQFIDELTARLGLNLKVFSNSISPAWQEARFGRLWEQGVEGLDLYNRMNKVDPMEHALHQLDAKTWIAGLRRDQSESRSGLGVVQVVRGRVKLHPIIDWDNRQVHQYLTANRLPYHPLWDEGYVSVGDMQTSQPLTPGMLEEETRFFGLKRECGLHVDGDGI